ncbi:MAG TPA: MoaD/ThiS family protein [Candidatus Limnocylindria bacterium]
MARIRVPAVLRPLVDGSAVVETDAATLGDLPRSIRTAHPKLAARVFAEDGGFQEFVNVFLGEEDARHLDPATPLDPRAELVLLPAVSGG